MIWFKNFGPDEINNYRQNNMIGFLDIEFTNIKDDCIFASMPVCAKTQQPHGLLHGGASCVLAESVGSMASNFCLDSTVQYAVGQSITTNHIRSIKEGIVTAHAKSLHLGKNSHIWQIGIFSELDPDKENNQSMEKYYSPAYKKLISITRLTLAVLNHK